MRRSPLPLICALSLLLVGCGARERTNPFDPLNPETGGKLPGFEAVAGADRVDLRWTPQDFPGGTTVRVERLAPPDTAYELLASVPLSLGGFTDSLLPDKSTFVYRVRAVSVSGSSGLAQADTASRGSERAWVCDTGHDRTVLLSPDNRKVRTELDDFSATYDVAYEQGTRILWVANPFEGTVEKRDFDGKGLAAYSVVNSPKLLALDPEHGHVWVADDFAGTLACIAEDGDLVASADQFAGISALAVDPADGGVWVAEPEAFRVTKIGPDGIRKITVRGFQNPARIAFDPGNSQRSPALWVADVSSGQLAKLTSAGQEIFRLVGYPGISALTFEPVRGELLVGLTSAISAGAILDLDASGRENWRASGPVNPVRIAVFQQMPTVPASLIPVPTYWAADAAGGAVWKISDRGHHVTRQGGFLAPQSIAVGYDSRTAAGLTRPRN